MIFLVNQFLFSKIITTINENDLFLKFHPQSFLSIFNFYDVIEQFLNLIDPISINSFTLIFQTIHLKL